MSDNVVRLKRYGARSLQEAVDEMMRVHPDAISGIVCVFDKDGGVHTDWYCNAQEMAFAAARLAHLAAVGGSE